MRRDILFVQYIVGLAASAWFGLLAIPAHAADPVISNVSTTIGGTNLSSRYVTIEFAVSDDDGDACWIDFWGHDSSVDTSGSNEASSPVWYELHSILHRSGPALEPDGKYPPGTHTVEWHASFDVDNSALIDAEEFQVFVRASDTGPIEPDRFMIVDLTGGPASESYPITYEYTLPFYLEKYKTDHLVLRELPDGSWMGIYEVSQRQYEMVTGFTPSHFSGNPTHPVEQVSWNSITGSGNYDSGFFKQLRDKTGLHEIGLPSLELREYACRAGTTADRADYTQDSTQGSDSDTSVPVMAWFDGNENTSTRDVGKKRPNAWGLFDMYGNVWEWTSTFSGPNLAVCGGSYRNDAVSCRSQGWGTYEPEDSYAYCGFRVAIPAGASPSEQAIHGAVSEPVSLIAQASRASVIPFQPVRGERLFILYDATGGPLQGETVKLHLGVNNWETVFEFLQMDHAGGEAWTYEYSVPEDVAKIDLVFNNGPSIWDHNGGVGVDWHFDTVATGTDTDADGLYDEVETWIGTNPNIKDTDSDGFWDSVEYFIGTDPLNPDAMADEDGDLLPDPYDPNPQSWDSDGDGIADFWEVARGSDLDNPLDYDTLGDTDLDSQATNVDAVISFRYFVGLIEDLVTDNYNLGIERADINRDSCVDNVDAVILSNFVIGNLPYIPFGLVRNTLDGESVTVSTELISGSFLPDTQINVRVHVSENGTGTAVRAAAMRVYFHSSALTFVSSSEGDLGSIFTGPTQTNSTQPHLPDSYIDIATMGVFSGTQTPDIVELTFDIAASPPADYAIVVTGDPDSSASVLASDFATSIPAEYDYSATTVGLYDTAVVATSTDAEEPLAPGETFTVSVGIPQNTTGMVPESCNFRVTFDSAMLEFVEGAGASGWTFLVSDNDEPMSGTIVFRDFIAYLIGNTDETPEMATFTFRVRDGVSGNASVVLEDDWDSGLPLGDSENHLIDHTFDWSATQSLEIEETATATVATQLSSPGPFQADEIFTVDVVVSDNPTGQVPAASAFRVQYDTAAVAFQSVSAGSLGPAYNGPEETVAGSVVFRDISTLGNSGNADATPTCFTLQFQVTGDPASAASIAVMDDPDASKPLLATDLSTAIPHTFDNTATTDIEFTSCDVPYAFDNLTPSNGSSYTVSTAPTALSWNESGNAMLYDVYLEKNDSSPDVRVMQDESFLSWDISPTLTAGTWYWQIVAKNACGTFAGPVWSFTIQPDPTPTPDPDPTISLSTDSFSHTIDDGDGVANDSFTIQNTGGGTLVYTVADDTNWMSVSPTSGLVAAGAFANITVTYNTNNMGIGLNTGAITVSDSNATNSPQTIDVNVFVAPLLFIELSRSTMTPSALVGENAPSDTFTVRGVGPAQLNYTISEDANWLSVTPTSGSSWGEADTITVNYQTSGLSEGLYSAAISVTAPEADNSPQTISVSLTIEAESPEITLNPQSIDVSVNEGSNGPSRSFAVQNTGGGILNYTIDDDANWLYPSRLSGSLGQGGTHLVELAFGTSTLAAGEYDATLTVTDANASNSPQTIAVSLTVGAEAPLLAVSPERVTVSAIEGETAPSRTFLISNAGGGSLDYSVSETASWLSLSPNSGTVTDEADTIGLTFDTESLAPDNYNAIIEVTADGVSNSPQQVVVQLTVLEGDGPEDVRALIVAGGGPYPDNAIISQTKFLAKAVYVAARARGLSADDIQFLSAFDTQFSDQAVDDIATSANIEDAIKNWASGADQLFVILIDHGVYDEEIPEWYFIVDDTVPGGDRLAANTLKQWLDEAQTGEEAIENVVLYIDMCYAGGFLRTCSGALSGTERVVIASTTDERLANFGGAGLVSFTSYFFTRLSLGNDLRQAFRAAEEAIKNLRKPERAPQIPWLDDNGDGLANGLDGSLAANLYFGGQGGFGLQPPVIDGAKANEEIPAPADYPVWMDIRNGLASRAEVYVAWTREEYQEGEPITSHAVVTLTREGTTDRFSGTIPASELSLQGSYTLLYTATTSDPGIGEELELAANPVSRTLVVGTGALPPDIYENDPYNDSTAESTHNAIREGSPQIHTIHAPGDEDWMVLFDTEGEAMRLEVSDYTVPEGAKLVVELFDLGLEFEPRQVSVTPVDTTPVSLSWQGTSSLQYVRVRPCSVGSVEPNCDVLTELNREFRYRITFLADTGNQTGKARQIDACAVSVPIPVDGLDGNIVGFNVRRTAFPGGVQSSRLNADPIPFDDCDCAAVLGPGFVDCAEFIDRFDDAGCPSGFQGLVYQIEYVLTGGQVTPGEIFTGIYNPFVQTSKEPICDDGQGYVIGDFNGDGAVTPSDAQIAFECFLGGDCPPGDLLKAGNACDEGDDAITPADAQAIFDMYLGAPVNCP